MHILIHSLSLKVDWLLGGLPGIAKLTSAFVVIDILFVFVLVLLLFVESSLLDKIAVLFLAARGAKRSRRTPPASANDET